MAISFLFLRRHRAGHLIVGAQIFHQGNPGVLTRPLTFIIDTASERSYVVPASISELDGRFGRMNLKGSDEVKSSCMVGDLVSRSYKGFKLRFRCEDKQNRDVALTNPEPTICLATRDSPLVNAQLHNPASTSYDPTDFFNILGRDFLNQGTLIVPPKRQDAYFIFGADIHKHLAKVKEIGEFHKRKAKEPEVPSETHVIREDQIFESAAVKRLLLKPKE